MMAQMKVHGISDKVMGLSSPRTMFFISLEPVKVFCQICPTRFFKDQKDPVFQGLIVEGAKKWGKSTKFIGNFQMLISQARSKLFENFKSLKSSSGHVVFNGNL